MRISREVPNLYETSVDRLALYASTQFKKVVPWYYAYNLRCMWYQKFLMCLRTLLRMIEGIGIQHE